MDYLDDNKTSTLDKINLLSGMGCTIVKSGDYFLIENEGSFYYNPMMCLTLKSVVDKVYEYYVIKKHPM